MSARSTVGWWDPRPAEARRARFENPRQHRSIRVHRSRRPGVCASVGGAAGGRGGPLGRCARRRLSRGARRRGAGRKLRRARGQRRQRRGGRCEGRQRAAFVPPSPPKASAAARAVPPTTTRLTSKVRLRAQAIASRRVRLSVVSCSPAGAPLRAELEAAAESAPLPPVPAASAMPSIARPPSTEPESIAVALAVWVGRRVDAVRDPRLPFRAGADSTPLVSRADGAAVVAASAGGAFQGRDEPAAQRGRSPPAILTSSLGERMPIRSSRP